MCNRFTGIIFVTLGILMSFNLNADTTARYQVERFGDASSSVVTPVEQREWLVWKYTNRVQLQQKGASYSVIWERMKDGALLRREVYPYYKTVVTYQPGDAVILGVGSSWEDNASLFDGSLLASLQAKGEGQLHGRHGELYEGKLHGHFYRIVWDSGINIPLVMEIRGARSMERITLTESFDPDRDKRYIRPDANDDYDNIDYADIGDEEAHPLVQALHHTQRHVSNYPGH